jgi:hypothetical protein
MFLFRGYALRQGLGKAGKYLVEIHVFGKSVKKLYYVRGYLCKIGAFSAEYTVIDLGWKYKMLSARKSEQQSRAVSLTLKIGCRDASLAFAASFMPHSRSSSSREIQASSGFQTQLHHHYFLQQRLDFPSLSLLNWTRYSCSAIGHFFSPFRSFISQHSTCDHAVTSNSGPCGHLPFPFLHLCESPRL